MTGQDWLEKDFYATLGVSKDADAAAIKKAYRKLARAHHPDQNPGNASSEARFKEIGEAYAVLSDPEERQQYDAIRAMGGGARFSAGPGGAGGASFEDMFGGMFGGGSPRGAGGNVRFANGGAQGSAGNPNLDDLLSGLFGGRGGGAGFRAPQPQAGADVNATTTLPLRDAVEGTTVDLQVNGKRIKAKIPAGVNDGQKIRLRGKGGPGAGGGPAGDLLITVRLAPHPVFALEGKNLRATVPVTFAEAALGATIKVPTLDGDTVSVKVAPGTPAGRVLRFKGRGPKTSQGTGDLLVTIQVAVPQNLSDRAREALEAFATATEGVDVREDLYRAARER